MMRAQYILTTSDNRQHIIEFREYFSNTNYGNDKFIGCYEIMANDYLSSFTYVDCRYIICYEFIKVCEAIIADIYKNRTLSYMLNKVWEEVDASETENKGEV